MAANAIAVADALLRIEELNDLMPAVQQIVET